MNNLFSIEGKTALVTGGSRGIGEMIAAGFLANGARVYISSRKADVLEATAGRLAQEYGGECTALPADLSNVAGTEGLAGALAEREERLDILVNNAGATWGAPLDEFPESGWDKVMDTNVKGIFFLTQKLLPLLRAAATAEDPARVINIGSIDGLKTPALRQLLLRCVESGGPPPHPRARHASGSPAHPRQRHRAGSVPDLDAVGRGRIRRQGRRTGLGSDRRRQPPRSGRHHGGHRRAGDLPVLAGRRLHRRRDDHLRWRRGVLLLGASLDYLGEYQIGEV